MEARADRVVDVRPAGGDDLAPGVEGDAFGTVDVVLAEQRVLPAAERVVGHRYRDRHVDADHADVDPALEPAGSLAAGGEYRRTVPARVRGDERDRLVDGVRVPDRQHRPEDLL